MELPNHDKIIQAINDLREVRVKFRSKKDLGGILSRSCAPMDYGPRRRASDQTPCYHFWDSQSDSGVAHVLSLPTSRITSVEVLDSSFDPASFVSWDPNWFVVRTTWGVFN